MRRAAPHRVGLTHEHGHMTKQTTDFVPPSFPHVVIATDGACLGNPGPGGWAFVMERGGQRIHRTGWEKATTNNRMEARAIIEALCTIEPGERVFILSDSELTVRGLNEWRHGWEARGWRKSDGKPVANADLWRRLSVLADEYRKDVTFHHVRGHAGHLLNEEADRLAGEAARTASEH